MVDTHTERTASEGYIESKIRFIYSDLNQEELRSARRFKEERIKEIDWTANSTAFRDKIEQMRNDSVFLKAHETDVKGKDLDSQYDEVVNEVISMENRSLTKTFYSGFATIGLAYLGAAIGVYKSSYKRRESAGNFAPVSSVQR